jgi:hypothetical protein
LAREFRAEKEEIECRAPAAGHVNRVVCIEIDVLDPRRQVEFRDKVLVSAPPAAREIQP